MKRIVDEMWVLALGTMALMGGYWAGKRASQARSSSGEPNTEESRARFKPADAAPSSQTS